MIIGNSLRYINNLKRTVTDLKEQEKQQEITDFSSQAIADNVRKNNDKSCLLEQILTYIAESNKSTMFGSTTTSNLPLKSSILGGIIPTGVTLSSSSLFNSFSTNSLKVILSFIGFDTKNLDLSKVSQVDFVGYFAKLLGKSIPDFTMSLVSTALKDILTDNEDNLKDDLRTTIMQELLGSGDAQVNKDDVSENQWSLATIKSIISKKSIQEQQQILDSLAEQAPYLLKGEYRNNASSPNTIPDNMLQTAKNCVAAAMNDNMQIKGVLNQAPWEIVSTTSDPQTGYWGRIYVNKETHEVIISNLATNTAEDAATDDIDMMQGKFPDQYENAVAQALKVLNDPQFSGYNVTISGLSLGGSLTELVASTKEVRDAAKENNINLSAISLNGYGITNIMKKNPDGFVSEDGTKRYTFVSEDEANQITMYNFITEDDLVSCSTKHYGNTILFENNNKVIPHMLSNIDETLNSLQAKKSKNNNRRFGFTRFPFFV